MDKSTAAMTFDTDPKPQGAARVGLEMRAVRERLGWRLADVASELRIRLPYLEAIERGELSALPGAAYQTGFVRTYSHALGLDGDEILRRFRAEGTSFVPKAELSFLAPVPDRAVPTGAIVLLAVVLTLVGYGLWYRHTAQEAQLAAQIPSLPTELAPLAVPPKPPAPAIAKTSAPAPAIAATTTPPASTPAPALPSQIASTATMVTAPLAATPQKAILATGDSWVQVEDSKGSILFSKTLHAGDSWPVPDLPGLVMTAGNAGNTLIAENGAKGTPVGAAGTVVRKFALTAPAPGITPAQVTPAPRAPITAPASNAHAATAPPKPAAAGASPIASGPVEGPTPNGGASSN